MVIAFVTYIFRRYVTFCILNAHLHQRKIFEKRGLGEGGTGGVGGFAPFKAPETAARHTSQCGGLSFHSLITFPRLTNDSECVPLDP